MVKRKTVIVGSLLLGIIAILADVFFLHRHSHFAESGVYAMDGVVGFYAALSVIGLLLLVGVARLYGHFFQVNEDYYDDDF